MLPDRMFTTFQTAGQGLAAQREKIAVASKNIANAGTTAPNGSDQIYRPQSVQTTPAGRDEFRKVLLDSVSNLRTTHQKHFPVGADSSTSSGAHGPRGLGPEFEITESESFRFEYDPNHPDADENGMVRYPDIDLIREMTQMVSANRLYEANLSSVEAEKEIIRRSLDI